MAIFYLDFEGGNDGNAGTSFALRWKTIDLGATAARITAGDVIRIMSSLDPTSTSVSATWTNNSPTVTLATALNILITNCDVAWTGSANVTSGTTTSYYATSTSSLNITIDAAFTTGKVAYLDLAATLDYSGYQGITFAFMVTAAVADGVFELRLCSDTIGDVAVDTFVLTNLNYQYVFKKMYIDKGANLGAAIKSIALWAVVDPGALTVRIDNISTVKAAGNDNVNLTTLIGKSGGADGGWYPLRAINGTSLTIDVGSLSDSNPSLSAPGWYGTTGSATMYIRKPIYVHPTVLPWSTFQEAGTAGNLITYTGGWNRTDMSTQTGDTYVSNLAPSAPSRMLTYSNFTRITHLHPVGWSVGIYFPLSEDVEIGEFRPVDCGLAMYVLGCNRLKMELLAPNGCNQLFGGLIARDWRIISIVAYNMSRSSYFGDAPLFLGDQSSNCHNLIIESYFLRGSNSYGMSWTQGCRIANLEMWVVDIQYCKSSGTWGFFVDIGLLDCFFGDVSVSNCYTNFYIGGGYGKINSLTLATPIGSNSIELGTVTTNQHFGELLIRKSSIASGAFLVGTTHAPTDSWVWFQNYNGVAGDHRGYYETNGAKIFSEQGVQRHTPSGVGWRCDCQLSAYSSDFPIRHKISDLILVSGVNSKIRLWVKRSNTAINVRLKVFGSEVAGIAADVIDTAVSGAGVWEELELSLTPTEEDTLGVYIEVWGGSTHSVYFDDFVVV